MAVRALLTLALRRPLTSCCLALAPDTLRVVGAQILSLSSGFALTLFYEAELLNSLSC